MKTVLLIEDNREIRENTGEILELANYSVLLASDGKEGAALALSKQPDIIICDIMMPELDGYGVIHLLQKHEHTQNIPFIFLTARSERTELRRGMELGADDYITKPFSGTELLNAIEGRLKKAASRAKLTTELTELSNLANKGNVRDLKQAFEEGCDTQTIVRKQRVYTVGHRPFRLYYVEQGRVKIFKTNDEGKELITGVCNAGDFFGYSALLEETAYRDSAEALEDCEIASITKETFDELMNTNQDVMRQFIKLLAGNVHAKEEQLLGIAYNSLRKKVAEALIALHKKYTSASGEQTPIRISRENLAAIAATAKESLIRTLGDFRHERLIDIQGTDIIILDEKKLRNLLN